MFLLIILLKKILDILLFGKQIMVLHTIITITFLIAMYSNLLNLRQLYNTISNIIVSIIIYSYSKDNLPTLYTLYTFA